MSATAYDRIRRAGLALAWIGAAASLAAQPAAPGSAPPGPPGSGPGGPGGQQSLVPTVTRATRQAHFEADEATRTIIVTADPATNEQIRAVIEALDQPVTQALIRVLFVEVTHTDDLDLGVDISHDRTDSDGDRSILNSLFGVAAETRGGMVTLLQNDLEVTMRAMAEAGRLNVLSRPSILARNNEEATITIGQEVPFIRNSRITEDGQTINTVEYEDIGIILTVTPHIGADGRIEMEIAPEISTLGADTVPISDTVNAAVFSKRSAETSVTVPSGRTVIIGGLMEDQETRTVRKVPVLGDIWGVGALFRRTITEKSKTELLIFLTPTVVDSGDALVQLTHDERSRAAGVQERMGAGTVDWDLGGETAAE